MTFYDMDMLFQTQIETIPLWQPLDPEKNCIKIVHTIEINLYLSKSGSQMV